MEHTVLFRPTRTRTEYVLLYIGYHPTKIACSLLRTTRTIHALSLHL
jgi:hypothetical protein